MAIDSCLGSVTPPDVICGGNHCVNYPNTSTAKRICKCTNPDGSTVPDCQVKTDAYPIETASCYNKLTKVWDGSASDELCQEWRDADKNWSWKKCFCCCSCVAWGTQVLVAKDIARSIEKINNDDPVMAATVKVVDGAPVVSWETRKVIFSDGTTPAEVFNSIRIAYGQDGEILCTGDQPLVLADGTYIQADRVMAGMHLLDSQGHSVEVTWIELGTHTVGLWHIATDAPDTHSMDGHLVSFNGLLAGDFIAQQIFGATLREDPRPVLGTEAYALARNAKEHVSAHYSGLAGREPPPVQAKGFVSYRLIERTPAPANAVRFVTAIQAEDIRRNAPAASPTSGYNRANFDYLVQLFRGFYPQIHIVCQWEATEPNLLAFEAFGVKTLLVSGALLRLTALNQDGLALIMAHGVARFLGAPPADEEGLACTGQADFFAVGYVINQAYYGGAFEVLEEAIPQIKALFNFIDLKNRGGANRCEYPSIECRLSAISAARSGRDLPHCAGAPTPEALKLEKAEVISVDDLSGLVLTFNLPLASYSVQNVLNYLITPVSSIQFASLDPMTPEKALLTVRFAAERDKDFTVQVRGVVAADGSSLDPAQSSATFRVGG